MSNIEFGDKSISGPEIEKPVEQTPLSSMGVTHIGYYDSDGSYVMESLPYGEEWIPSDAEGLIYE